MLTPSFTSARRVEHEKSHVEVRRRLPLSKNFGLIWFSQLVSQVGDGISKLALLWFVYSITGSPLKTTAIGLLQTIPPIVCGPVIGVLVDRFPKKFILIGSNVFRAMLIGFIPCAISVDSFTVNFLYVLVLVDAMAMAALSPTLTASVPMVVPRAQFTSANALIQSTTSLGIIFGPALSGMGIALFGPQEVLCLNAATYVASALCLVFVQLTPGRGAEKQRAGGGSLLRDLQDGLAFVAVKERVILLLIVAAGFYGFGASALTTLFPVYTKKMLDLGPIEVGYLWSTMGVGLLVMSIVLLWFTERTLADRINIIAWTSAVSGLAIGMLVWTKDFVLVGLLMIIIGAGIGAFTPIAWSVMQELTPGNLVGRVMSLYSTGAMTAAIGGISMFGWVTERFGESTGLVGIGTTFLLTAILGGWLGFSTRTR
ncbi:MAG TPA: MFS transporter [Nitrospiraceae bacterium]|nr:MFS transporter [Nitrospiraceae bacterium]